MSDSQHVPRTHGLQPRRPFGGKALVTGAAGHVGANLVHRLLCEDRDVRVLLRPASEKDKARPWSLYEAGKFQLQFERIGGNIGTSEIKFDPVLSKLATGKLELEYEGEMKGADNVGRELIRSAIAKTFDEYFTGVNLNQVVQWFDLGGEIQLPDNTRAQEALQSLQPIQGLMEKLSKVSVGPKDSPELQVSAA